ncbi:MAG TPA: sensor domain-containing protein [Solirubrobacteraceae bacterium]
MTVVTAPAAAGGLELRRHLRAAGRTLGYLALGLANGLAYLLIVGGGALAGAILAPLWIGLPLLALVGGLVWRLAEGERRQANRLLDAHLPALARPAVGGGWRRALEDVRRRAFWRALAMLALRLPGTLAALVLAGAPLALAAVLAVLGLQGLGGGGAGRVLGPLTLNAPAGLALCVLAVAAAVVGVGALEAAGGVLRSLARALLRSPVPEAGPVRELLAERLGDRTLNIAYWLPERRIFVDETGRKVELPDAGSGRAWTAVERDGHRVAAIVHDAELDATPELVQAAASAAALAIDNERLKANLRARVEELRASRVRIVEAADEARRRIERDLHDGAQQQLVALALDLRMLRARLGADPEAAAAVDDIAAKLSDALSELRELARGIHPAILSERGLGPAVEALVGRAPLAVACDVHVDVRLPPAVEAAAYFVVAEGLTNVVRYAHATHAAVTLRMRDGEVLVEVADDGVGGADATNGSGVRGLAERLGVLEGSLSLDSPPGGGTRLRARIPCRPDPLEVAR